LTQKKHVSKVKVRYAETDQMGVVHHSNYPIYCELARTEWLETFGVSYREMEENGIMLPLSNLNVDYKKPAKYNDELFIITSLKKLVGARIEFAYRVEDSNKQLVAQVFTTLVFVDMKSGRPTRCPEDLFKLLS